MDRNSTYEQVCAGLNLDAGRLPAALRARWPEAQRSYPGEGPAFLRAGFLASALEVLCLAPEDEDALRSAASRIGGNEGLRRLIWFHGMLAFGGKRAEHFDLPFPDALGGLRDVYPAVLLLAGLPDMLAFYSGKGIGRDVLADTLKDVSIWMEDFRRKCGRPGLSEFRWIVNHLRCRLFRIGRLQFMHTPFDKPVVAYRNRRDGRVAAFSAGGVRFREDGLVSGTNGVPAGDGGWTAVFRANGSAIRGTMLSGDGFALPAPVTLRAADWEKALGRGNGVLDVHIPADGRMDADACRASFADALAFFMKHFPEKEVRAFVCESWLLDPQLGRMLGRESNIARLQNELFLFPILSDDRQTFERVFGREPGPVVPSEAGTSMQKAIAAHLGAGGRVHGGGMFLLADDLGRWGTAFYRNRFIP